MQNFEFHNPTHIIFGKDTIRQIGNTINQYTRGKILFIAGGGSIRKNGVYEQTIHSLESAGLEWIEIWGVQPNPTLAKVEELIDIARKEDVKAVLAVGGGSVLDTAKTVAAGLYVEHPWIMFEKRLNNTEALPVFSVLTLSATGSEFDAGAVITNEAEKKKWFFMNPNVAPKASIIDPTVQETLPWFQTVNGAIDAMAHIMEPYFLGGDNEATLSLIEGMIHTIIRSTDRLKQNPMDYEARASLAWVAALALSGIAHAGQPGADSTPHALEHGIGALDDQIAHGAGLAVVFPAWIEYVYKESPQIFSRWAMNVWKTDTPQEAIARFRAKIRDWGHPVTLKELGIHSDMIPAIATNAYQFGLPSIVKQLSEVDYLNILKNVEE